MGAKDRCKALKCVAARDSKHLMCRPHWALVPAGLKDFVYEGYRAQLLGPAHLMAMEGAIFAVALLDNPLFTAPEHAESSRKHMQHKLGLDAAYAQEEGADPVPLLQRLLDALPEDEVRLGLLRQVTQALLAGRPWAAPAQTGA